MRLNRFTVARSKDSQLKFDYRGIDEIAVKVRSGEAWKENPLRYGEDKCADGDHTIVTVIYPNKKVEAIYVRCWQFSSPGNQK